MEFLTLLSNFSNIQPLSTLCITVLAAGKCHKKDAHHMATFSIEEAEEAPSSLAKYCNLNEDSVSLKGGRKTTSGTTELLWSKRGEKSTTKEDESEEETLLTSQKVEVEETQNGSNNSLNAGSNFTSRRSCFEVGGLGSIDLPHDLHLQYSVLRESYSVLKVFSGVWKPRRISQVVPQDPEGLK
mmetsp:Transcript_18923/g.28617  ORF Transcript_18923/g.28617 Transcript_18923/m.28617 type:complete len:184 (+) Transcript_18923:1-552(+)